MIPVPLKDRTGRPVRKSRRTAVLNRLLSSLGTWFGSATVLPSWGSWKEEAGSPLSIDKGQLIVLVMTNREKYRRHRSGVARLLKRAGRDLDQQQMAAIAFHSAKGSIVIQCRP
ncbi:MAG: hypothetical protein EHM91_15780 [Planctomycetota bacterium]|nr:MAG: hypothetical protein EHM91_15780 [Planctomycetota bacterium]